MELTTNVEQSGFNSVLDRLPPFPAGLLMILRACSSDSPSATDIAAAVSMEEVLAARVVRAANAANMAPVHAVDNVVSAVSRLGSTAVRGLATSHFMNQNFNSSFNLAGLDRQSLWRHNLSVAAASAGAAGGGEERANAYFAGLIHDVGKMILAAECGGLYADCIERVRRTGEDISRVEMEMLGTDHADVGAQAAAQWNFNPDIVDAIRRHHQVLAASLMPALASHVLVGDQVANEMGLSSLGVERPLDNMQVVGMAAGIGAGIMSRSRWALTSEMPRIEALLSVLDH